MTEKNLPVEGESPKTKTKAKKKAAKPPISKAVKTAPETNGAPAVIVAPPPKPEPKTNGDTPADVVSKGRGTLLQVDSYHEAEALLTERPELIEQARTVFGAIVPTTDQNEFMDLTIRATAEDDPIDLRGALAAKRKKRLTLTEPEVEQLLEFAAEQQLKSPALALNVALLLTDDLTRLEDAAMWQKQKDILLAAGEQLDVDVVALWQEISQESVKKAAPKPKAKPVPVKVKAEAKKPKKKAPPLPPTGKLKNRKSSGPPRWLLASSFIFLMGMLSCGACAIGNLF